MMPLKLKYKITGSKKDVIYLADNYFTNIKYKNRGRYFWAEADCDLCNIDLIAKMRDCRAHLMF